MIYSVPQIHIEDVSKMIGFFHLHETCVEIVESPAAIYTNNEHAMTYSI